MRINDEGAIKLLESMVSDSAAVFTNAVWDYIKANEKMTRAIEEYGKALEMKARAVKAIREEYGFLNGEEPIKPPIDADQVAAKLIKKVMEKYKDESDISAFLNEDEE